MARILVADDDPGIRDVIEMTLDGHQLHFAEDGIEALEVFERQPVDLVVLDIMMPNLDGLEVARRIRRDGSQVPILVLSAKSTPADRERGMAAGADAYVAKPFDTADLTDEIDRLLA